MARRITSHGEVTREGRLTLAHRDRFVRSLPEVAGRVVVTVERPTRKLSQNALYHLWVRIISDAMQWDPEYTDHWNKMHCNARTVDAADPDTGEIARVTFPGPTHSMSAGDFAVFMDRVFDEWMIRGIPLPGNRPPA